MLGKTTLPERAVDTWVAAYLASQMSRVALWAPTQRTKVDFDISVLGDGKLFVLEQKAPIFGKPAEDHHIQIDVGHTEQLWRYCTDPELVGLVWYVLPRPPYSAAEGVGRGASLMPELARARLAGHRWGSGSHKGRPCQEWFHMVPAQDLYTWLRKRAGPGFMPPLPTIGALPPASPPLVGKRSFPCDGIITNGPQNVTTLKQWVSSVKDCSVGGGLVRGGRVVQIGRLVRDGAIIAEGRQVSIPLDQTPDSARDVPIARDGDINGARKQSRSPGSTRVVFAPRDDIPGWT